MENKDLWGDILYTHRKQGNKPKTIYIVVGNTGWYDSYHKWLVKAFVSEERAKKFIESAKKEYEKIRNKYGNDEFWFHNYIKNNDSNPLDPNMYVDDGGVQYFYKEVEIDEICQ